MPAYRNNVPIGDADFNRPDQSQAFLNGQAASLLGDDLVFWSSESSTIPDTGGGSSAPGASLRSPRIPVTHSSRKLAIRDDDEMLIMLQALFSAAKY